MIIIYSIFYTQFKVIFIHFKLWIVQNSLLDVLNSTDKQFYPDIYTILSLLLTLPMGSCSCERSFSALRLLKTWCRATMKEERPNGLALTLIHNGHPLLEQLDPLRILKAWDGSLHRKIALAFDE